MQIISHRGYWLVPEEKNKIKAFNQSFSLGFGLETDIRDYKQDLIISHDMPFGNEIKLSDFLNLATSYHNDSSPITLALNIKSDGLAAKLKAYLEQYPNLDIFVFDMSIPDMRAYLKLGINTYTRVSEIEEGIFIPGITGVWLDCFEEKIWYNLEKISTYLDDFKVCIVSLELHGYSSAEQWSLLKPIATHPNLQLCTDWPEQAQHFFENRG